MQKGFHIYDRPTGEGSFEKCCFRLVNKGKQDAEVMASFHETGGGDPEKGKKLYRILTSGKYKDAVFIDSKNGKTKEYRFTKKTLMRKILSLKAKWER